MGKALSLSPKLGWILYASDPRLPSMEAETVAPLDVSVTTEAALRISFWLPKASLNPTENPAARDRHHRCRVLMRGQACLKDWFAMRARASHIRLLPSCGLPGKK